MRVEYALTAQDYLGAQRLHFRPGRGGRFMLWLVAGFVLAALIQEVYVIAHHGVLARGWWLLPAGLAYGGFLFFIFLPWRVGKIFRSNPRLAEPMRGEISDEGLLLETKRGVVRAPWNLLKGWKHDRRLLLIYHSRVHFHIFPRRAFAEEDYAAALALLEEHLGRAKS